MESTHATELPATAAWLLDCVSSVVPHVSAAAGPASTTPAMMTPLSNRPLARIGSLRSVMGCHHAPRTRHLSVDVCGCQAHESTDARHPLATRPAPVTPATPTRATQSPGVR